MNAYQLGWSPLYGVDCEGRKDWPDLVFNLGGKDFRMSPYDYAQEFNQDGNKMCLSMLIGNDVSDDDEVQSVPISLRHPAKLPTHFKHS